MPDNLIYTEIKYLKGVGPKRGELLQKELGIFTIKDLLYNFPYKYIDRTKYHKINELKPDMTYIQVIGKISDFETVGHKRKQRLVAHFSDSSGVLELVWFKGAAWIQKQLKRGVEYVVFGKPTRYGSKLNMAHPEIDVATAAHTEARFLQPVYNTTELLNNSTTYLLNYLPTYST